MVFIPEVFVLNILILVIEESVRQDQENGLTTRLLKSMNSDLASGELKVLFKTSDRAVSNTGGGDRICFFVLLWRLSELVTMGNEREL